MSFSSIQNISLNPFLGSKIIMHFLNGYGKPVPYPLVYLVFPIVFYKSSRDRLINATTRSSLETIFFDLHKDRIIRESLAALEDRVKYFKDLTNQSLIVASNDENIVIEETIRIMNSVNYKTIKEENIRHYCKSAHYLGVIFSKQSMEDIFTSLEVWDI